MAVFLLLMVVVVILLVTRLGTARTQIETLTENLNATQQELDAVLAELEAATPVPTPTPTPTPAPTPSPSQSASPEPSEEASPTPTAAPLLKDTITQEVLGDVEMPRDESWFDEAQEAYVSAALTLHVRSGPGTGPRVTLILYCNTKVEVLAKQDGWSLIRLEDKYGWVARRLPVGDGGGHAAALCGGRRYRRHHRRRHHRRRYDWRRHHRRRHDYHPHANAPARPATGSNI